MWSAVIPSGWHLAVMAFNDPFVADVASVDFTPTER
jgi:hypothetical protein